MNLRFGSVCDGIGAAACAWTPLGWEFVFKSEIEAFPIAVTHAHWPEVPNYGDMTKHEEWPYQRIDVLVGGTPCQAFSVAGLRKGLADPRGNLTLTFLGVIAQYRPRWVVWENVPGVLSSISTEHPPEMAAPDDLQEGEEREYIEDYEADSFHALSCFMAGLEQLGYGCARRILDAQYFGVAQRRRRVFVVGCAGGQWQRAAAVLFERHSLSGNPAPRRETGEGLTHSLAQSLGASGRGYERAVETRGQDPVVGVKITTEAQRHGVQTFAIQERAVAEGKCGPDGKGWRDDGAAYTLEARHHVQAVAFPWQQGGSADFGQQVEHTQALTGHQTMAVAVNAECGPPTSRGGLRNAEVQAIAGTLKSNNGGGGFGSDPSETFVPEVCGCLSDGAHNGCGLNGQDAYTGRILPTNSMAVRRLTPRECERLQGFPDDWTAIEFRKKPAADGPRYKALGNSMAVPVMRWIGERIELVEGVGNGELAIGNGGKQA